jgi:hypothetical protein
MIQILAFKNLGYSYLYSLNMERTMQLYYMFRELVTLILLDASDTHSCFHDQDCILMGHKPYGIPAWKLFSFHFWDSVRYNLVRFNFLPLLQPDNPLGPKWTLSPEEVSVSACKCKFSVNPKPV